MPDTEYEHTVDDILENGICEYPGILYSKYRLGCYEYRLEFDGDNWYISGCDIIDPDNDYYA